MSKIINCHEEWNENSLNDIIKNGLINSLESLRNIRAYRWLGKETTIEELPPNGLKVSSSKHFQGTVHIELDTPNDNYKIKIEYQDSSKKGKMLWEILIPEWEKNLVIGVLDHL